MSHVTDHLVEFTARYATSVPDLPSAWSAVMGFVDRVGDDPQIEIRPYWRVSEDETERRFEVVVSGMVEVTP